jgi:metallo-beta-lactamase class B
MKFKIPRVILASSLLTLLGACNNADMPATEQTVESTASGEFDLHVAKATAAAQGVAKNILNLCDTPKPRGGDRPAYKAPNADDFEAAKVFDNLYFVGTERLSAWAVKTSEGIILLDTLNNDQEAEAIIVTNMQKLGLDPNDIKYIVIAHGHGDHYGGAKYLKDKYGPSILASSIDWDLMESGKMSHVKHWGKPPARDLTIEDGQQLTLGDTSLTLYITPGHTPGTVSMIIPVTDNGKEHVAVLWGGTGFNFDQTPENYDMYASSAERLRQITNTIGADVLISNHGFVDSTPTKLPALINRKTGEAHPYVGGPDSVQNFLTVAEECARARKIQL